MPYKKETLGKSKVVEITSAAPVVAAISEEFITVKQVAERLHVKPSTIYEWTRRRQSDRIPSYPMSRKVILFRWSEVVRWVENRRQAA